MEISEPADRDSIWTRPALRGVARWIGLLLFIGVGWLYLVSGLVAPNLGCRNPVDAVAGILRDSDQGLAISPVASAGCACLGLSDLGRCPVGRCVLP